MNTRMKPSGQAKSADPTMMIRLEVNGQQVEREISVRMLLSDFLRHELGLTGTHVGCEHGICGACTILLDGRAARSCLTFAVQADGLEVRTIESVAGEDRELHPLQEAFQEEHALQCGYCTPGMIMNLLPHLEAGVIDDLSDQSIRELISGNLCRCTGYANIVKAVRNATQKMK